MQSNPLSALRTRSVTHLCGSRSRQRGYGEEFFLLFISGVGLLFLLVYSVAIWFGNGYKGKIIGFLIATGLLSPIWYPTLKIYREKSHWSEMRLEVSKLCASEIERLPASIKIDSLVDETGGLRSDDIIQLLTSTKLNFVDIKLGLTGGITGNEDYPWPAEQQHGYAHLQLGDSSSSNCYYGPGGMRTFFSEGPPVKPGTCLQVSYLDQPVGKFILRETRTGVANRFSTWILQDKKANKTVASVTDAFRLKNFNTPVPRWDRRGGQNHCKDGISGYGLLLDRVIATKESTLNARRRMLTSSNLVVKGTPTINQIRQLQEEGLLRPIKATDIPFDGDYKTLQVKSNWVDSYAAATKLGASMFGNQLILPSTGDLINVSHYGISGKWGTTGSQLVFVQTGVDANQMVVLGANFQGKLLWNAQMTPLTPLTNLVRTDFDVVNIEVTHTSFLIHGIFGYRENRKPWTISIPLGELSVLEAEGRAGANP